MVKEKEIAGGGQRSKKDTHAKRTLVEFEVIYNAKTGAHPVEKAPA
jgi:hypothetical protein